ncbi:MAG: hypothetical protein AAFV53_11755, partial [Myxococcota bacterium]
FRVEPGQIEVATEAVPTVAQAVVAARPAPDGGQQLVAWVRPEGSAVVDVDSVRTHLTNTLPTHMVPAAIVCLDSFPVTVGGKVDERALPDPEPAEPEVSLEPKPRAPKQEGDYFAHLAPPPKAKNKDKGREKRKKQLQKKARKKNRR